jgi:hypothetical protein
MEKDIIIADKKDERSTRIAYDLFDNPTVAAMLKSMSPEEVHRYKVIGQEMYGNVDFLESKILNNIPPPMTEALAFINIGLRSGLLPMDLTKDEINLMVECKGPEWYLEYGFTAAEAARGPCEIASND